MCVACVGGQRDRTQSSAMPEPVCWTKSQRPQGEWHSYKGFAIEQWEKRWCLSTTRSSMEKRMEMQDHRSVSITAPHVKCGRHRQYPIV